MPPLHVATTPNILLLMVDQMRFDAMGCAGHPDISTPALDRLAATGVRFTQAYSPVPVCIPARHSMLTGRHCSDTGRFALNVPSPEPQLATLPQILGHAGYLTHAIGKMHFRPVRRHFGFHRMELMEEIPEYRADDEYLRYLQARGWGHLRWVHGIRSILYLLPQVSVLPEEHHGSTWVADRTVEFLRANRDRPFFCFSSWIAPHPPWNAPEPFASMYDAERLSRPVASDRDPATLPPAMRSSTRLADATPEQIQRIRALYYGQISLIDKGVGRILDALDETGLADNTLVLFTADHGEMLGDQGRWGKHLPYEPSAHIPLLARMPGRACAGTTCDDLVSLLDVLPTALDVARQPHPERAERSPSDPLPGQSLLGRANGGLATPRERLVIEYGRGPSRWLALREGRWRYAHYLHSGWEELYDLETDPHELHNLVAADGDRPPDPADLERAVRMRCYLEQWEAEHGFGSPTAWQPGPDHRTGGPPNFPDHSPRWVFRLDPEERAALESTRDALLGAIAREPSVSMEFLEESGRLDEWRQSGGHA